MPNRTEDETLIASLEQTAALPAGILGRLLALESEYPDLSARGARRNLYRSIETILDEAADRIEAQ